jgi:hypothetical protein
VKHSEVPPEEWVAMMLASNPKALKCPLCDNMFIGEGAFRNHATSTHNKVPPEEWMAKVVASNPKAIKCPLCAIILSGEVALRDHTIAKHSEEPRNSR